LVLIAETALAHPPPLGIPGLFGGMLHPLFVPAHAMALAGLGLLIGMQPNWGRMSAIVFIGALALGLGTMTFGIVPRWMGEIVLTGAAFAGALVALARALPEIVGVALAVIIGVAVALDSPPEVISLREANRMLLGTGLGATALLVAAAGVSAQIERTRLRIGLRVLGSWIAAGATLSLALLLAA
jgi:hydrogenase/urease accessory protein HupE